MAIAEFASDDVAAVERCQAAKALCDAVGFENWLLLHVILPNTMGADIRE